MLRAVCVCRTVGMTVRTHITENDDDDDEKRLTEPYYGNFRKINSIEATGTATAAAIDASIQVQLTARSMFGKFRC